MLSKHAIVNFEKKYNFFQPKKPICFSILGLRNLTRALQSSPILRKTSMLRRLQAETLPDEAPPIGKINPFSKRAITFEPLIGF